LEPDENEAASHLDGGSVAWRVLEDLHLVEIQIRQIALYSRVMRGFIMPRCSPAVLSPSPMCACQQANKPLELLKIIN
jgi:hypothetical protein